LCRSATFAVMMRPVGDGRGDHAVAASERRGHGVIVVGVAAG
jgi:hypothetical protein